MQNYDSVVFPKSEWGEGPWQNEPDRVEWRYKGFPCLMRRNMWVTGSWCGYVAVPPSHPLFEKSYKDIDDISVHGGLNYTEHCHGEICHKPEPGEPDNVWWLGFDCAHGGDLMPRLGSLMLKISGHGFTLGRYRNMAWVKKETKSLADQLVHPRMVTLSRTRNRIGRNRRKSGKSGHRLGLLHSGIAY